ncbi:hypothetical protein KGA00_002716 [Enterococcus faecalis]|nr:hypothetical protein [Enterococcus faecalis]
MIPQIEVWLHDNSVGYAQWFEIDSIDYLENRFVILDDFGNLQEFSGEGRLFRVKNDEEKQIKFYEIKFPYFALIAAENQKQCLDRYRGLGCEVEDEKEFFANIKTIDKSEAFHLLSECHDDEFGEFSMEKFLNEFKNVSKDGEVLLIDYALMCGE